MKNIAVVTGASSGMGREFVLQIADKYRKFDEIWAIARSEEKLQRLQGEASLPVRIFPMDLTAPGAVGKMKTLLAKENPKVRMLVLSAGCGKMGGFLSNSGEEQLHMIDLNCRALTDSLYAVLPFMPQKSRCLLLASSAAFAPQPGFAVYAATKAYVLSLSRALRQELKERELQVTAVCPGPVDTAFFDTAGDCEKMSRVKRLSMAKPEAVVHQALRDAARDRELSVYGLPMKGSLVAAKVLPHHLLVPLMDRLLNNGMEEGKENE